MICNAALAFALGLVAAVLSMARADDPASASTSFFICAAPAWRSWRQASACCGARLPACSRSR